MTGNKGGAVKPAIVSLRVPGKAETVIAAGIDPDGDALCAVWRGSVPILQYETAYAIGCVTLSESMCFVKQDIHALHG